MKAITLTQPWATLVALGAKSLETRSWGTAYRGPLAIHAGKGLAGMTPDQFWQLCNREPFRTALAPMYAVSMGGGLSVINADALPRGLVVATCQLTGCYPTIGLDAGEVHFGPLCLPPKDPERSFGDFSAKRFAWRLEEVQRLATPIAARGEMGLWDWEATP